jgi:heme-degrading monooxygenase HmoA
MISRIWHGWTTPANADAYEALLREEIFAGIAGRQIPGYRGIQLLRRAVPRNDAGTVGDEVEFVTIMRFDDLEAVRLFAGDDYEVAVVPPKARAVLARFDARSQHYEIRTEQPG